MNDAARPDHPDRKLSASPWPPGNGEMVQRVRALDWAATPLGPIERWSQRLRGAVEVVLASGFPMVARWGPELVQVYNDGYRALMGDKHPAGLGQPSRRCWPELWHISAPIHEQVLAGRTLTFEDTLYPVRRSGRLEDAWFTLCYSPLRDEAGDIAGVLVTVVETTERHLADAGRAATERTLREGEARQAFLLRLADTLRQLVDPIDIQAEATRVLGEHLGADRVMYGEAAGPTDEEFVVHGEFRRADMPSAVGMHRFADFGAYVADALRAEQTLVVPDVTQVGHHGASELAVYDAVGVRAYVAVPLVKAGRIVAYLSANQRTPRLWSTQEVALVDEVAQRTWAAVERARAEAALREADRRKDEFLAMLGHELRNPLAPIANAHLVLERSEPLTERGRRVLAVAQRQAQQMKRLVDDLLEVSRITRGKIELRCEPMNVQAAVSATVEAYSAGIAERGQSIEVALPTAPLSIMADPTRFAQVLDNLLNNARKFTPDGGRIRIEVEAHGDLVELRVHDTGVGIAPDQLPQLFELFSQVDATLDRSQGGLGIGLALVRRLVELHGGTVSAASEGLGKGSTFAVRLPCGPASRSANRD